MPIRSFTLDSPEAYEALCGRRERPWIPNGALPREPKWKRGDSPVWVGSAEAVRRTGEHCPTDNADEADRAFREWMAHVDAGRIG